MNDLPRDSKPMPALPSHLLNDDHRAQEGQSPLRTSVGPKEREKLTVSIISSTGRKPSLDIDTVHEPSVNGHDAGFSKKQEQVLGDPLGSAGLNVSARDPRDRPVKRALSRHGRPASPYTLNPPIDFDGLSWPSEFNMDRSLRATTEMFFSLQALARGSGWKPPQSKQQSA